MGYRVSSLENLPVLPNIGLYVFIVGDISWKGGFVEQLLSNFDTLAKELGRDGAIVAPHNGQNLSTELSQAVNEIGHENKAVSQFLKVGNKNGVGLLLMSEHPYNLKQDDMIAYSPIEKIQENFGSLDVFFTELCNYSKDGSSEFIDKFKDTNSGISNAIDAIDLNPNIFGLGINLNPFKEKVARIFSERFKP